MIPIFFDKSTFDSIGCMMFAALTESNQQYVLSKRLWVPRTTPAVTATTLYWPAPCSNYLYIWIGIECRRHSFNKKQLNIMTALIVFNFDEFYFPFRLIIWFWEVECITTVRATHQVAVKAVKISWFSWDLYILRNQWKTEIAGKEIDFVDAIIVTLL